MSGNPIPTQDPSPKAALSAEAFQAYCARVSPGATVKGWVPLAGGWESALFAFTLAPGPDKAGGPTELVLRLYNGTRAKGKAVHEFDSLLKLHAAGYPVPRPHHLETEAAVFGRPFVLMERVEGRDMGSLFESGSETRRRALADLLSEWFVRLHRLDPGPFLTSEAARNQDDPFRFFDAWLREARGQIAGFTGVDFDPVLDWLEGRREEMACERGSAVHNDFHPFNVMVRPDGSPVVLDWTGFGVSDARFDLAWTLQLAHGYYGSAWRAYLLHAYERFAGGAVAQIETFEVAACARRLFDLSVSLLEGPESRGMRAEAVEAMKRDTEAHHRVYTTLVERTGIELKPLTGLFGGVED